jgi:hypothetical protein
MLVASRRGTDAQDRHVLPPLQHDTLIGIRKTQLGGVEHEYAVQSAVQRAFEQAQSLLVFLGGFKHEVQRGIAIDETPLQAS